MRLEAESLTTGYSRTDVLHDVSLSLDSGEFVGLIGPNGCGKSTLLRVLTHTLPARTGTVRLGERSVASMSPLEIARLMAFVPQQEAASFDFTVREVVLMGRYPHRKGGFGDTEADFALVRQALAETGLLPLADRPITRLSGGEHRRVLLARALVQQTPLLLLDEPTAHLDPTHQVELMQHVRDLTRQQNVGAMAALHDLNQAAEYCDRLILLLAGQVIAAGTPQEVLTTHNLRLAYAAETHIGSNPITGRLSILSLRPLSSVAPTLSLPRVHVVCGGGSGAEVLATLTRMGFPVTTGVLNRLDSDQIAAHSLGLEAVVDDPFTAISPASREQCERLMQEAEWIIVTDVPFGKGNLGNLEMTAAAQEAGKQIVLLGDTNYFARDFCDGVATRIFDRLNANRAVPLLRIEEWKPLHQLLTASSTGR